MIILTTLTGNYQRIINKFIYIMKTTALLIITVGLLIFTIAAFSLAITKKQIEILPFAVLGLILTFKFKKHLLASE